MPDELFGARAGARIAETGNFRYHLWRTLSVGHVPVKTMVFVMLNPSTADETKDDPTITRCIGFARREGFNQIEVVNLFAYRATKPKALIDAYKAGIDIEGPDNLRTVDETMRRGLVVLAWGAHATRVPWRLGPVGMLLANWSQPMFCLGYTKTGQPRHPLMVKKDQPLERWGP